MKHLILLSVFVFTARFAGAQPPGILYSYTECYAIYLADKFTRSGDYDRALDYYNWLIDSSYVLKDNRGVMFKAFLVCKSAGKKEEALKLLLRALDYGLHCVHPNCVTPGYMQIFDSVTNNKIDSIYTENNKQNNIDYGLIKEVKTLIAYEDKMRVLYEGKEMVNNKDSVQCIIDSIDRVRLIKLKRIVYKYGWPGYTKLGYEADNLLWLLVQHSDEDVPFQEYVLKLIAVSVLENNTNKKSYAYLYDRVCVNTGKEQVFGTQIKSVEGEILLQPMKDAENVDIYRKSFDLPPLSAYIKQLEDKYLEQK